MQSYYFKNIIFETRLERNFMLALCLSKNLDMKIFFKHFWNFSKKGSFFLIFFRISDHDQELKTQFAVFSLVIFCAELSF